LFIFENMKYPVGIQDFRELRTEGYVYIDKTRHIYQIVTQGKNFFLSRPRRFGKSLLLSTMNELYSGSHELFEGLWVEKQWDWEGMRRPVVWLRISQTDYQNKGLYQALQDEMLAIAQTLNVGLESETLKDRFRELIRKAGGEKKTVLLIDEYDKPIIDYLDEPDKAEQHRDILKSFYSILKDSDPHLELVFITGVSAFSKVSIFSDLNNLYNLSIARSAQTLLGITQQELEHYFAGPLSQVDAQKVQRWYNGYGWGGEDKLYNPYSILSFFKGGGQYNNFWFETGTPTFLVKEMKRRDYYNVRRTQATVGDITNFDLRNLQPIPILFQTGYLTIIHYEPEDLLYTLDYPNFEVKHALEEILLKEYLNYPSESPIPRVVKLRNALQKGDVEGMVSVINTVFASLPYDLWKANDERFFHAIVHLTFSLLGTYIRSEAHSSRGRCDAIVETEQHLYALEFKLDKPAAEALQQIEDKGYLEPYADSGKERLAVGVSFSSEERKVVDWVVKDSESLF